MFILLFFALQYLDDKSADAAEREQNDDKGQAANEVDEGNADDDDEQNDRAEQKNDTEQDGEHIFKRGFHF